jgi:hypothetical protein
MTTLVGGTVLGESGTPPVAASILGTNTGDLVLIGLTLVGGTGHTVSAISDTNSNTWGIVGAEDDGVDYVAMWACYGLTTAGVSELTFTTTFTGTMIVQVAEFVADVPSTWTLDGSSHDTHSSSSADVPYPTVTPTYANELFFSVANANGGNPMDTDTNPYEGWSSNATQIVNYNLNLGNAGVPYTAVAANQYSTASYAMVSALFHSTPTGAPPTGPLAPTITAPLTAQAIDVSQPFNVLWDYNTQGSPPETGYQLRVKIGGGSYSYFDQSTGTLVGSPVDNYPSNNSVATIPGGLLTNGNTYDISVASIDSSGTGPFAADTSFDAIAPPTMSVAAYDTSTTSNPIISWTVSYTGGNSQAAFRVVTYSIYQVDAPDFVPGVSEGLDDSGWVADTSITDYTLTNPLPVVTTAYVSYVFIIQTPGLQQVDSYVEYTLSSTAPSAPDASAAAIAAPNTGVPAIAITVTDTNSSGDPAAGVIVLRSDGNYVTGATTTSPYPITGGGTVVIYDFEASGNTSYYYEVFCVDSSGVVGPGTFTASVSLTGAPTGGGSTVASPSAGFSMWIPSAPDNVLTLRLASRASGANSIASGGDAVWVIDRPEDQGIFQPFGRSDSVVIHGDMRDEQFDLDLVFIGNDEWNAFDAMRSLQQTVALRSDMTSTVNYYALGGTRPVSILRGDRFTNPIRQLTITFTPVLKPT